MKRTTSLFWVAALLAALSLAAIGWRARNIGQGYLIALLDLPYCRQTALPPSSPVEAKLVAHAGGAVNGEPYTNSREALDEHYAQGYRVFELDFHWTSDGQLVLVHDWPGETNHFGLRPHALSYAEFVTAKRTDGLHQLTFSNLRDWLQIHRDAFVVTDTKASNLRLLAYLNDNGGDIRPQLIIQIYRMSELQAARKLGPRAVWLTVYRYHYPPWALSRISGVDAFVIPVTGYSRFRQTVLKTTVHFYVHSVAAASVEETLKRLPGIYGVYVD
jgi:hypothetical protein